MRLFKIYIFLLPILLIPGLRDIKNMISANAYIENDLFILGIGMLLIIIENKGKMYYKNGSISITGMRLCFFLILISLITSVILFPYLGTLNGENTLSASFTCNLYMIILALAFYYNSYMFKKVSFIDIERILDVVSIVVITVGYIQIGVISFPGLGYVYDSVDFFDILVDSDRLIRMGRVCFTGSEPSAAGDIINVLIWPYLLGQILYSNSKRHKHLWLLSIVPVFMTLSSTCFIGIAANCAMFYYLYVRKGGKDGKNIANSIIILFVSAIVLFIVLNFTEIGRQIHELLFVKTRLTGNMSSEIRFSSVINDIRVFLKYPISGIGNGNQGYYYNETVSKYLANSQTTFNYSEISERMSGKFGIVNGGAFVPAFISGYGLIGIIAAIKFIKKCKNAVNKYRDRMRCFSYMYFIGGISFLILTTVSGELDGNFLPIFIVSIPFMTEIFEEVDYTTNLEEIK